MAIRFHMVAPMTIAATISVCYMLSAMKNMMRDYGEHFDFLGLGMARMSQVMGIGVPKAMVEAMKETPGIPPEMADALKDMPAPE